MKDVASECRRVARDEDMAFFARAIRSVFDAPGPDTCIFRVEARSPSNTIDFNIIRVPDVPKPPGIMTVAITETAKPQWYILGDMDVDDAVAVAHTVFLDFYERHAGEDVTMFVQATCNKSDDPLVPLDSHRKAWASIETLKEDLMAAAWHPRRLVDWCMDTDERAEFLSM